MINCFAITEKGNLAVLAAHLEKYPLKRLLGSCNGLSLKYSEIMGLLAQLIFVDHSLSLKFKRLLEKLAQYVSVVYLAGDKGLVFQAFGEQALDSIV